MKLDPDIEPLVQEMSTTMADIQSKLLPLFDRLNEDIVIAHYSPDEQARIYLSAAFTMALSLYAVDKLSHRSAHALPGKRGVGGSSNTQQSERVTAVVAGAAAVAADTHSTDAQLVLKIERITDYIKKLRDITQLSQSVKSSGSNNDSNSIGNNGPPSREAGGKDVQKKSSSNSNGNSAEATECSTDHSARSVDDPGRKRARSEAAESSSESNRHTTNAQATAGGEDDVTLRQAADAKMFALVTRKAGETGTAVGRLLRHVDAPLRE